MTEKTLKILIKEANQQVLEIMLNSDLFWIGIKPSLEAVPGMQSNTILHAGPPIKWERMCNVQKRGIIGGILHEKLAKTEEEANQLIIRGEIDIQAANDLGVVGPGVGITTSSMVVHICEDRKNGKQGYCIPYEGRSGLSGGGVYNDEVEKNLQTIENVLAPAVDKVLQKYVGINVKSIIARGFQMNDEAHTRQVAMDLIIANELFQYLVRADLEKDVLYKSVEMIGKTERWFHPLGMASSMAILNGIKEVEYSTVVTAMAGNGVEMGIKVSSLGDEWFTAPAPQIQGKYLSTHWGLDNAIPWIGDSCVTEAVGMGGMAAAAAPAVAWLLGETIEDAVNQTEKMKNICVGINHNYPIPYLEFTGPPIGIDMRKVLETGISPICHGGIISKKGGQIGAGKAIMPLDLFKKAFYAFAKKYGLV